jgi:uncharacterized repeat protein (TIGR01451 family)
MKTLRSRIAALLFLCFSLGLAMPATAQNFNFTIEPGTLTLVPGQTASFVVSLTPLNGFTNVVSLTNGPLPSGVTATYSPQSLTPPGTSLLTLNATTNATVGSFTLSIIASGGGITNTTSSSVTVNFGLLPTCYGALQGTITDTQTGLPVPYAVVTASSQYNYYAVANANGQYIITNLALAGSENLPIQYYINATRSNYWNSYTYAYAVCGATNIANLQILSQEFGSISGTLTAQGGQPLTNVTVVANNGQTYASTNTDVSGAFRFPSLLVGNNNNPINYNVSSTPPGYWIASSNTLVVANSNSVVNLVALPICHVTISGSVVYGDTGLPATNLGVQISTSSTFYATTDSSGNYTVTNATLFSENQLSSATIVSSAAGYYQGYTNVALTGCGQSAQANPLRLAPIPVVTDNYGTLTGHVYDIQTGLPVTNGYVTDYQAAGNLNSNGFYLITNVLVGTGVTTQQVFNFTATGNLYFQSTSNLVVQAGQIVTQDFYLLHIGYGGVAGAVLDSVTGLPVAGVGVSISLGVTGANGQYSSGPLQLSPGNAPTYESFYAQKTGYWTTSTNTTITNNVTNIVNIQLIKVCTGATVVGNVVNALTQQPITNATVTVSGIYLSTQTDTNGNFIITNITVGNDNSPIQSTLTASAPGFNSQSKNVTIFCGATISTQFGAPETSFGIIQGYVTNAVTGQPMTNVFIGSEFGEATTTDTNGFYILSQAPLGPNNAARTWTVSALPNGYPSQTKSVVVASNITSEVDFGFGQPPTALAVSGIGTPNPVTVGSNLVYTIALTNSVALAQNVQLIDTLPPGVTYIGSSITNDVAGAFSPPVLTNNSIITLASNFNSNSVVMLLVTVSPTTTGILTNVVTVSSTTPDLDVTGSNHIATMLNTVVAPVPMHADIGVTATGVTNSVPDEIVYTFLVNNSGPADAPSVVLTDNVPAGLTISNVTVSQGTSIVLSGDLQWNLGGLSNGASATATVVVISAITGSITNNVSIAIVPGVPLVTDLDPDNDQASVVNILSAPTMTNNTTIVSGPIVFNPQTGLYYQTVQFNNNGTNSGPPEESSRTHSDDIAAVQISVLGLPSGVVLYNASGTSNGVPYVEYDGLIATGGSVVFTLEYYDRTRQDFVSTNFVATVVPAATIPTPTGTTIQLDSNGSFVSQGQLTIEFASVPGRTYVVQYSSDMQTWLTAAPPIVARNTKTDWVDSGPPVTQSLPGSPGQRFYRVVQTN